MFENMGIFSDDVAIGPPKGEWKKYENLSVGKIKAMKYMIIWLFRTLEIVFVCAHLVIRDF